MTPVRLSSLVPSETELDAAKTSILAEFASECTFGDLEEAIGNVLDESQQQVMLAAVKRLYAGNSLDVIDHIIIGALVVEAFRRHVEKWAGYQLSSYIEGYQTSKAEELQERGVQVEWAL